VNSLTTPPLSTFLAKLFADAEETTALRQRTVTPQQRAAAAAQTDYKKMYTDLKDFHIAVSPETGSLLYMLARSARAKSIVEFGTSFAISTLHMAAALRDNGGGRLITSEFVPSKVAAARQNIAQAGFSDLVDVREGDALETLGRDLPDAIDLVLLDGAKPLYPKVLALLEGRLRSGAFVLADNADWCPEYLAYVRSAANGYLSVPFGGDVELSMRM
jgi:predicted O-methyltransferase YrrM